MAGQALTSGQGSVGRGVTLALVGIAIALSQGTMGGGVSGQELVSAQGSVVHSLAVAPSGLEVTVGQGTITPSAGQQTLTGQVITSASGTIESSGQPVTVNLSGVEAEVVAGDVFAAQPTLATNLVTTSAGTATYGLAVALSGLESVAGQGSIAPELSADDTFVQSSSGAAAVSLDVALSGSEVALSAGDLILTDGQETLTGSASTVGQGTAAVDVLMALSGQEITAERGTFGAPGMAELSGSAVTVTAGDVFTTDDRTYALVGQSIAVQDGLAVTSYLAFATGQVLTVGQEGIGPRTVDLSGQSIEVVAGSVIPPVASVSGSAGGWNHHFGHKTRTKKDVEDERIRFGVLPKPVQKALTRAAKKVVDGLDGSSEELGKIEGIAKAEIGLTKQRWKHDYLKAAQGLVVRMLAEDDETAELAEIAEIFFNMN